MGQLVDDILHDVYDRSIDLERLLKLIENEGDGVPSLG